MNDRINELLEQLREEVFKTFCNGSNAHIRIEHDGFISFSVEQVQEDDNLPVEAWKRRQLYDSWKTAKDDDWRKDRSGEQNAYYKARKILLEVRGNV